MPTFVNYGIWYIAMPIYQSVDMHKSKLLLSAGLLEPHPLINCYCVRYSLIYGGALIL